MRRIIFFLLLAFYATYIPFYVQAQVDPITHIPAAVEFDHPLQLWDGFGFNYVETAQTRNYKKYPQDYGGFSILNRDQKHEILELVFGEQGLGIEVVKMFLDPWHQPHPGGAFDHETTTRNMLDFVEGGLRLARNQEDNLSILTTLYGPPPWATLQDSIGGRDLDTAYMDDLARYMTDWAGFLRKRDIPVKYLSIHNEGEDFYRWDHNQGTQRFTRFDYNMYWPPDQVNDFMVILADEIKRQNMADLYVTNGEPSNWTRFAEWGYGKALFENEQALESLGLLTTHGFINGDFQKLSYGTAHSRVTGLLRQKRPDLHAWITSFSWGKMDTKFVTMVHEHIYNAGVNAMIPWAGIQRSSQWIDGDPNPGTAIRVLEDSTYEVTTGYYLYKQLTRAGRRGMAVARTMCANPVANLIAFSGNGTENPDAFILTSYVYIWKLPFGIRITGSEHTRFNAYRTTEDGQENYEFIGTFEVEDGMISYDPPYGSVTTFIGVK